MLNFKHFFVISLKRIKTAALQEQRAKSQDFLELKPTVKIKANS